MSCSGIFYLSMPFLTSKPFQLLKCPFSVHLPLFGAFATLECLFCRLVPFGSTNVFSMPIDLTFWGQPENKMRTIQTLSQNGFMLHEGLTEYPKGTSRYLNSSQASGGENSGYTPGKRTFMNPKEVSELLYVEPSF